VHGVRVQTCHVKSVGVRGCALRNLGFRQSFCKEETSRVIRRHIQIATAAVLTGAKLCPGQAEPSSHLGWTCLAGAARGEGPWSRGAASREKPAVSRLHEQGHGQEMDTGITSLCPVLVRSHLGAVCSSGYQHCQTGARSGGGRQRTRPETGGLQTGCREKPFPHEEAQAVAQAAQRDFAVSSLPSISRPHWIKP